MVSSPAKIQLLLLGTVPDSWEWPAPVDAWLREGACEVTRAATAYDAAGMLISRRSRFNAVVLHPLAAAIGLLKGAARIGDRLRVPVILTADDATGVSDNAELPGVIEWSRGVQVLQSLPSRRSSASTNNRENSKNGGFPTRRQVENLTPNRKNVHQTAEPGVYTSGDRISGDELNALLGPG